jgi:hypothetical protein
MLAKTIEADRGLAPTGTGDPARSEIWLPNVTACENGLAEVVLLLPERRKRSQDVDLRLPKVVGDLALAERLQGLLDAGEARNREDVAARHADEDGHGTAAHSCVCAA